MAGGTGPASWPLPVARKSFLQSTKLLMAQKSNPTSLRLEKTNQRWASIWYGDYYYTTQLLQGAQISAYLKNVSSQGKFPPPVIFLTRERQQVQMALFFPKSTPSRLRGAGKRGTGSTPQQPSGDPWRRWGWPGEMPSDGRGESPLAPLRGDSLDVLSQRSALKNWCASEFTQNGMLPAVEKCPHGVHPRLFPLRYLMLHFFALHSPSSGMQRGGRNGETVSHWQLSFHRPQKTDAFSLEKSLRFLPVELSADPFLRATVFPGSLEQVAGGIGGGVQPGVVMSNRVHPLPRISGQSAPYPPGIRGRTPFQDHLERCIHRQLHSKCKIHFLMVHSHRQNPLFLASHIVFLLQEKMPFRRLKDQIIREVTRGGGIRGIRITCSGRVASRSKKAQKAKKESIQWGETGLHVFSSLLSFACRSAYTSFGKIGVKVWICYEE